ETQYEAIRSIAGFENAKMFRPGYAIEYDFFPPTQLKYSLETKKVENLFFAGQINGTTGYEEAACQGLMAGINAHQKIKKLEPINIKSCKLHKELYAGFYRTKFYSNQIRFIYRKEKRIGKKNEST